MCTSAIAHDIELLEVALEQAKFFHRWEMLEPQWEALRSAADLFFQVQGSRVQSMLETKRLVFSPQIIEATQLELQFEEEFGEELEEILDSDLPEAVALAAAINAAAEYAIVSGIAVAAADLGVDVSSVFGVRNILAEQFAAQYGPQIIDGLNETTSSQLMTIITNGIRDGTPYNEVAYQIRERFEGYSQYRAELIATNVMGTAYEAASFQTAQLVHSLPGSRVEKFWLNVGDHKVTPGCRANTAAGWIDLNRAFPSGHMHPLRFPRCRCTTIYRRRPSLT